MDLDLRVPVGLLFVILGLIMGIFGLTSDPALYHKSLDINVNLVWGIVELIFGSLMIAFGRSSHQLAATAAAPLSDNPLIATTVAPIHRAATSRHDVPPSVPPVAKPPVRRG